MVSSSVLTCLDSIINKKIQEISDVAENWFAVTTHTRKENLARENLERQGFLVLSPTISLRKRRRGNWQAVIEPMFPGYLFVCLTAGEDDFSPIRSTVGCKGLVRFGLKPQPISPQVMLPILELGDTPIESELALSRGDRVRFEEGPLEGLEAIYVLPRGEDRVKVLLNILGRSNELVVKRKNLSKLE